MTNIILINQIASKLDKSILKKSCNSKTNRHTPKKDSTI